MNGYDPNVHIRLMDEVWETYLEYVSEITRITLNYIFRLIQRYSSDLIFGDIRTPMTMGG